MGKLAVRLQKLQGRVGARGLKSTLTRVGLQQSTSVCVTFG